MPPAAPSLYERLGGATGVDHLLVTFYGRVLDDPELRPFFVDTAMSKLRHMQHELFSAAMGGPHAYSGRELAAVHAGRGITERHFHLFRQHLLETLQACGVEADDMRAVIRHMTAMQHDIVGGG